MNLGTETMNQSTTAHVDFEIISANASLVSLKETDMIIFQTWREA